MGRGAGGGRGTGQGRGAGRSGGADLGRGAGQGGGDARGQGPGKEAYTKAGSCVCPECGKTVPHRWGIPCADEKCPDCNVRMIRKD